MWLELLDRLARSPSDPPSASAGSARRRTGSGPGPTVAPWSSIMRSRSSKCGQASGEPCIGRISWASSRSRFSAIAMRRLGGDVDVLVAAHDALVACLVQLDAVAAAVLGRLAGGLGHRERVGELHTRVGERRDPDADRGLERRCRWSRQGLRPLSRRGAGAQRLRRSASRPSEPPGNSSANRSPELRAASAPGTRYARTSSPSLAIRLVADVHAEVVVDDVQPVDVDVQRAPAALAALHPTSAARARCSNAGRVSRPVTAVVAGLDDRRGAARQKIREAALALREFRGIGRAEQREHAARRGRWDAAPGRRARGSLALLAAGLHREGLDHHRLASQLRQRNQLSVRARQRCCIGRRAVEGAQHHQALLRNDQRGEAAAQMISSALQQRA